MKRFYLLIALVSSVFISVSCNNSSTDTTTKTDSVITKDTLKSDSSSFSDPH